MTLNPESTKFGRQAVSPEEKTGKVIGVFDSVANRYDLMNDLMSGGLHRIWKDSFVRRIRPRPGQRFLDVAGGTGDIAFRIKKRIDAQIKAPPPPLPSASPPQAGGTLFSTSPPQAGGIKGGRIAVCDLNPNMLSVGRDRVINRGWVNDFDWVTANAESLPFPDEHFDVYTIAFGLRNVTHIDTALREACRVLKPGGRFYCLEFSHVENPLLAKAYDVYSCGLIPQIGQVVAKDRDSYQYLVESIRAFPTQRQLKKRLGQAGFANPAYQNMSAGIVAIHSGTKL